MTRRGEGSSSSLIHESSPKSCNGGRFIPPHYLKTFIWIEKWLSFHEKSKTFVLQIIFDLGPLKGSKINISEDLRNTRLDRYSPSTLVRWWVSNIPRGNSIGCLLYISNFQGEFIRKFYNKVNSSVWLKNCSVVVQCTCVQYSTVQYQYTSMHKTAISIALHYLPYSSLVCKAILKFSNLDRSNFKKTFIN